MNFIFGCWSRGRSSVDCRIVVERMARFFERQAASHMLFPLGPHFAAGVASFATPKDGLDDCFADSAELFAVADVALYDGQTVDGHGNVLATPADELVRLARAASDDGAMASLNGDFAAAVLDKRSGELTLVRDHLGILPLYYSHHGDACAFSTVPRPLLEAPWANADLDPVALATCLITALPGPERTCFKAAKAMLPATRLLFRQSGAPRRSRYWRPVSGNALRQSTPEQTAEAVRGALVRSVVSRTRGYDRIGVKVSGGLDSSSIAAILCDTFPSRTFDALSRVLDPGSTCPISDERPYLDALGARYPNLRFSFETATAADPLAGSDVWNDWHAAPCGDGFFYVERALAQAGARQGSGLILSGDGGDYFVSMLASSFIVESLLRGDMAHFRQEVARLRRGQGFSALGLIRHKLLPALAPRPLWHLLRGIGRPPWHAAHALNPAMAADPDFLSHLDITEPDIRRPTPERSVGELERKMLRVLDWYSPSNDAIAQAPLGVRERFPMLDRELVELCFAAPSSHKVNATHDRLLIRAAVGSLLPPEIAGRTDKGSFSPDYAARVRDNAARLEAGIARGASHDLFRRIVDVERALASARHLKTAELDNYDANVHELALAPYFLAEFLEAQ